MNFSKKLKVLRLSKKMTQDDLAEKLNISRQSISKWEQGINEPNIETIKTLCIIFDINISELIDDKEVITTKEEKQLKLEHKLFLLNFGLGLFVLLLTAVMIRLMEDTIPMHYDIQGNITRYGSKWESLFFLGFTILICIGSILIHFYYVKKKGDVVSSFISTQVIFIVNQSLVIIGYLWMGFSNAKDISKDFTPAVVALLFALLIVLSIFSAPKFNKNRNKFFGFRTTFTLSNQEAWEKVNYFQSIISLIFSIMAYVITIATFKSWSTCLLLGIIVSIIPTLIYHEILRKRSKEANN